MKHLCQIVLTITLMFAAIAPSQGTVLLDDTWTDGTRNSQNLPTESAWYASTGAALTAAPGAMTLAMGSSAILGVTYFTTNANDPASLNVDDTLLATITFTFNGVAPLNTSQGFRLALCNFGTNRVSADFSSSSSQGDNVPGYALFQTMGVNFNNTTPMDIRNRTTLTDKSLLGTSGDWTSLGTGPGSTNNFPGFTDGEQYTLQLSLQRTDINSLLITATWLDNSSGATLSTSMTDTDATNFNFDGIGLRPQTDITSASDIIFNEVRVELVAAATPPSISTQPQDQSVFVSQNATFTVIADGTLPFSYQWYYNNDTMLTNETNATLTITNAQLSDTGGYSVIVSNAYDSVESDTAELTVSTPSAPVIVTQPQDQTVLPGQSASFNVVAGGSAPFSYQWYYNTNTLLTNATGDTLTLTNIQITDAGTYSVVVGNFVNFTNSSSAVLSVNTNPVAPVFSSQPASQIVLTGDTASFSATAVGTAPVSYQWNKNGTPITDETNAILTLVNVQSTDAGSYTLTASNSVNSVTSSAAVLTVTPSIPVVNSAYDLTGFGRFTTGGGVIATNDPAYVQVYTPLDFANALQSAYKTAGSVKVIEIMTNLNLGWNEVGAAVQAVGPFRENTAPLLHPVLLTVGESLIDIKPRSGLTIFSANGATIKHCNFNIKSCSNVIIRNLKFDENWEWDENTKGQYDRNDWDFITIGNGGAVSNLWVDHCTFTKSYDGMMDTKAGCSAITMSWCKCTGDDGATNLNSWVWQQINYLEASPSSYPMYNFLRTRGFSTTNIVTIMQAHDKTCLAGQNDLDPNNATITMTFHHNWLSVWDRNVPRLRAGNVHVYNDYVDDTSVLAAKRLRDSIAATMSTADQDTLNNTYDFDPPVNGTISTENGAILVQNSVYIDCLWPLRNNQTDPSDPEYTGKIEALDTIYHMDNADGTVTEIRGNNTDAGNPLGPFQAPVIPFSWNLPNNQLPYTYTPDDPAQLQAIVTSPTAGAGAGVLAWDKTNWLMTTYASTAPFIVAQPQSLTVATNQNATFTVLAGGSANLIYQWYFNTNTPVADATNSTLILADVQTTDAGVYSVVVTNSTGSATSTNAVLNVSTGAPAQPQISAFAFANGIFSLTVNGDAKQNYTIQASTNLTDWTDLFTTNPAAMPFIWNDTATGNFSRRFYRIQIGP